MLTTLAPWKLRMAIEALPPGASLFSVVAPAAPAAPPAPASKKRKRGDDDDDMKTKQEKKKKQKEKPLEVFTQEFSMLAIANKDSGESPPKAPGASQVFGRREWADEGEIAGE